MENKYNDVYVYDTIPIQMASDPSLTCFTTPQFVKLIRVHRIIPRNVLLKDDLHTLNSLFANFSQLILQIRNIDIYINTNNLFTLVDLNDKKNQIQFVFSKFSNIRSMTFEPDKGKGDLYSIANFKFPKNLKYLNLSNNNLTDLDKNFKKLSLKELNLSFNELSNIKVLNNCLPQTLQRLNLSDNQIELVHEFKPPYTLIELNLSNNNLNHLDNLNIFNTTLNKLNLSNCSISNMNNFHPPSCLVDLNLSNNGITSIKHDWQWPIWLKKLNLKNTLVQGLPELPSTLEILLVTSPSLEVYQFPRDLTHLSLSNTTLSHLPQLNSLQSLKLLNSRLNQSVLSSTPNLLSASLTNCIIYLPELPSWPKSLQRLILANSLFKQHHGDDTKELDLNLEKTSIYTLSLSGCKLDYNGKKFPSHIRKLDLSRAGITDLTKIEIGEAEWVDLTGNPIAEDATLGDLRRIEVDKGVFYVKK